MTVFKLKIRNIIPPSHCQRLIACFVGQLEYSTKQVINFYHFLFQQIHLHHLEEIFDLWSNQSNYQMTWSICNSFTSVYTSKVQATSVAGSALARKSLEVIAFTRIQQVFSDNWDLRSQLGLWYSNTWPFRTKLQKCLQFTARSKAERDCYADESICKTNWLTILSAWPIADKSLKSKWVDWDGRDLKQETNNCAS